MTPKELRSLSPRELHELLISGDPLEPDALTDRVFHGTSLGLPRLIERLTWKTFVKAFHRDPELGVLRGWNVRTEPGTWTPQRRRGRERAFGHFLVEAAGEGALVPQGLLLDYGAFNPVWQPLGRLRDPLVLLPNSGGLVLGTTLLSLGLRLGTRSYFCLTPGPALQEVCPAPRFRPRPAPSPQALGPSFPRRAPRGGGGELRAPVGSLEGPPAGAE